MRSISVLLACLVALLPVASAFPSSCHSQIPAWRRFTNRIVARLWGLDHADTYTEPGGPGSKDAKSRPTSLLSARYGRDIVLRFNITTSEEALAIAEASSDLYLDVWEFNDDWVDIRLAVDVLPSLLGLLPPTLQHAHTPLIPDSALAEIISHTAPHGQQRAFSPSLRTAGKDIFFADYQPLSVITPWMQLLASMFSSHTSLVNIGKTDEGRDILALRVGVHPTNDELPLVARRTIIISGGTHAREWISTSSVTYVAYQLVTSYGKSRRITKLLEHFDFIFIPTLNPDGYAYTWETDRLWRKNRQSTDLRFCHGLDLDRAFGFEWDGDARPENPCSESYAGTEPWEAVEAKQFADWAKNETESGNVKFVALLDLHSYSQQVLYPYSFSCAAAPPTLEDLEELALGLAKAMKISSKGHTYRANSACEGNVNLLQRAKGAKDSGRLTPRMQLGGGSLLDWCYHELKINYAFQIKLRDMGSYGFLLPKEHIIPQGRELLAAVTYLGSFLSGEIGLDGVESHPLDLEAGGNAESLTAVHDAAFRGHDTTDAVGISELQWELRKRRR